MTVKELREKLKHYPDDTMVLVPGYESGFNRIRTVRSDKVFEFAGLPYYEGRFQKTHDSFGEHKRMSKHDAILLIP